MKSLSLPKPRGLVEKRSEATSEAQDAVAGVTVLSEALSAGCAMNLFFNKL
jgi:hypothetical protein